MSTYLSAYIPHYLPTRPFLRSLPSISHQRARISTTAITNQQHQYQHTSPNDTTISPPSVSPPYIPVREHVAGWHMFDAAGVNVGKLAVQIARLLQGKHRVDYTPHIDRGDNVVVLNVDKIRFSGNKWAQKKYYKHSGYPGGLHVTVADRMRDSHPDWILRFAVSGNVPMNRLKKPRMSRLKCYVGTAHPHAAQFSDSIPLPSSYIKSISTRDVEAEEAAYQAVINSAEFANSNPLQPKMGGQHRLVKELVRQERKAKQEQSRKNNE